MVRERVRERERESESEKSVLASRLDDDNLNNSMRQVTFAAY